MITITFIRHGESEDNLRDIWAGWKDAPLSALGRRQALAVAKYFSTTRFDYIYASPSLRARATGEAIHAAQPHNPPLTINPKLREQHFGLAEGEKFSLETPPHKTLQELFDQKIYPVLSSRQDRFPQGESLEDLARRAKEAVVECVLSHVHESGVHIAIASHGLCIFEIITALLRLDPDSPRYASLKGLVNTGWSRAQISVKDKRPGPVDVANPPPLDVVLTDINRKDHLADVELAGEGTAVKDGNRSVVREFFGGNRL